MLNQLLLLNRLDTKSMRRWFLDHTLAKIMVMMVYLVVVVFVGLGIYLWSKTFFSYLITFELYGGLTTLYILRSSFVMLVWIGILSSLISTLTFLLSKDRLVDLLITLPLSPLVMPLRFSIRAVGINLSLFLITIFPLLAAYFAAIKVPLLQSIPLIVTILLAITILSESIGSAFAYLINFSLRSRYRIILIISYFLFFITASWLLVRMIFPAQLSAFDEIPSDVFVGFYNSLPLIKNCILVRPIISLLTVGFSSGTLFFILGILLFSVLSFILQKTLFLECWQVSRSKFRVLPSVEHKPHQFLKMGLGGKDVVSLIRSTKEMGYLFFLLLMTITFFGLFGRGYVSNQISSRFSLDATIFAFVWFVFFTATYLIRFVYPFMMNEGKSRWWYFTIPLPVEKLLLSKISASVWISTPLFLIAASQWWILPFSNNPGFLTALSLITLVFLTIHFCLIGSLKPDFNLAYLPDKASTTLTGILSLIITMAYAILGGWSMRLMFLGELSQTVVISAALATGAIITILLWILVGRSLLSYTLDS